MQVAFDLGLNSSIAYGCIIKYIYACICIDRYRHRVAAAAVTENLNGRYAAGRESNGPRGERARGLTL